MQRADTAQIDEAQELSEAELLRQISELPPDTTAVVAVGLDGTRTLSIVSSPTPEVCLSSTPPCLGRLQSPAKGFMLCPSCMPLCMHRVAVDLAASMPIRFCALHWHL